MLTNNTKGMYLSFEAITGEQICQKRKPGLVIGQRRMGTL